MKPGNMIRVVVLIVLALALGCSHAAKMSPVCEPMEAGFQPDASLEKEYPYSQLREGKALVIFMRPSRFDQQEVMEVLANGTNVGMLRAKRYTLYHAKPGENRFMARSTGREPVVFDVYVEAGKAYFVELAPGHRTVSAQLQGHFISPEDGKEVLRSCELEKRDPAPAID
jgi:hypothetical protein